MDHLEHFLELLQSYGDLRAQQRQIDGELAKLTPVIKATYDALEPRERLRAAGPINKVEWQLEGVGLKQAVRMALDARSGEWLTPPEIRDYLETVGFNFGTASARGLASVGTTLKRMVPDEIDAKPLAGGQIGYRSRSYNAKGILDAEVRELLAKQKRK